MPWWPTPPPAPTPSPRRCASCLGHLLKQGTVVGMEDRLIEFDEFNKLVGLEEIRDLERHYYRDIEEDA